jgi:opacity protein-like surface antigen
MKKIILSFVSAVALSGFAVGGGDIVPVETVQPTSVSIESSTFYVGLGLGQADVNDNTSGENWNSNTFVLQVGYVFNPYVAMEGRYSIGFNMDYDKGNTLGTFNGQSLDNDFSSWGIYVKPMYPVGDFNVYALLGYGGEMLSDLRGGDAYEDGFQWGLGVSYNVTENWSVFVDYVSLYDDTGFDYVGMADSWDSDTWTIGVSYKF